MPRLSPAAAKHKQEYNQRYQKETFDRTTIRTNKEIRLPELLDVAVSRGLSSSRQRYVIAAILRQLEEDGVTLDE